MCSLQFAVALTSCFYRSNRFASLFAQKVCPQPKGRFPLERMHRFGRGDFEVGACVEGDYRLIEKFKSSELLNQPIRPRAAQGESTSKPTTQALTSGSLGRIGVFVHSFK